MERNWIFAQKLWETLARVLQRCYCEESTREHFRFQVQLTTQDIYLPTRYRWNRVPLYKSQVPFIAHRTKMPFAVVEID